jgi:hypothetical protein
MIFPAINLIRTELNNRGISTDLGNVGELVASGAINNNVDSDIILSLINIEENRISRDPRNYQKTGTDVFMKNPAVHLHLTLLFSATHSEGAYGPSLQNIQRVIQFFQEKNVFDHNNTPGLDNGIEKLILEMVSINLEQLNHLWSIIGGRYQPSVVYKMRMVTIDSVTDRMGSVIREVQRKYYMEDEISRDHS